MSHAVHGFKFGDAASLPRRPVTASECVQSLINPNSKPESFLVRHHDDHDQCHFVQVGEKMSQCCFSFDLWQCMVHTVTSPARESRTHTARDHISSSSS
eukprot:2870087-Rhodomonas_salina.1